MKRCHIQAASIQTPAEHTGVWLQDNCLRLVAAVIGVVAFCFVVNWVSGPLLNLINSGGGADATQEFSGSGTIPMGIKLCGSLVIAYLALFRLGSRGV